MNKRITYRISLLALLLLPIFGSCKKDRTIKPLSQLKSEQRRAIDRLTGKLALPIKELENDAPCTE